MDWLLVASALLAAAALVIGTILLVAWRRRAFARRYALRALPPLVIRARGPGLPAPPPRPAFAGRASWSDRPVAQRVVADENGRSEVRTAPRFAEPWLPDQHENGGDEALDVVHGASDGRGDGRTGTLDGSPPTGTAPSPSGLGANGPLEAATDGEKTVRLPRPMEETLQFLPGRLEVTDGEDRGQSIRFVRLWGEPPVVTFGRSAGPAHRHVQLRSLTVSRIQARMRYEGRRWEITNLSETNPTLVNGLELTIHESRLLEHGDRIEMGEVVFRYWEY